MKPKGSFWRWAKTASVRLSSYSGVKVVHGHPFLPTPRGRWQTIPEGFHNSDGTTEPAYAHVGPNFNRPPMVDYMGPRQELRLELEVSSKEPTPGWSATYEDGQASGHYEVR
jgi:hypothetical protein